MAAPTDIDEAIAQALLEPAEITDENGRKIRNRTLKELQDARDRETSTAAARQNHMGLRFVKLIPPGAG